MREGEGVRGKEAVSGRENQGVARANSSLVYKRCRESQREAAKGQARCGANPGAELRRARWLNGLGKLRRGYE